MLFNSSEFLIFFPIVTLIYFLIPHKFRYLWLLACSYYFYMCWNPTYALLILFSTAITYASGLAMEKVKGLSLTPEKKVKYKKICVAVSVILNLSVLAYFKYYNFFVLNINEVLNKLHISYAAPQIDVLLPVGISFYTFQALSYTMDVYRDDIYAEKNFFKYALFVSFFPQLVAGPIERSKNLLVQLNEKHTLNFEKVRSGFLLMLWGYFLKLVIADRVAIVVNTVYGDYENYSGWYLIVASVLFAIQIYCDFAGYSTIAMGAAEIMGFRLTDNFNAPYMSRSVMEFWRRWHISLSSWFKDYLYIPLGGNRKGKWRKYLNLLIVFLLSGLWHGSEWSFVVWGGLNGLFQIIGELTKPLRNRLISVFRLNRESFGHKLLQTVITFVLVDITWVFFRADKISDAIPILRSMASAHNVNVLFDDSLFNLGLDWKNFILMIAAIMLLLVSDIFKYNGVRIRERICEQDLWFRWMVMILGVTGILLFGIWGTGYDASTFIYFQF